MGMNVDAISRTFFTDLLIVSNYANPGVALSPRGYYFDRARIGASISRDLIILAESSSFPSLVGNSFAAAEILSSLVLISPLGNIYNVQYIHLARAVVSAGER